MTSLDDLRVIDAATLFAGPSAAMMLGDFGADVIKIEHPRRGDPSRGHGASVDGVGLWWKTLSRNKRTAAVDLSRPEGQEILRRLAERSDVLIENFRPGTLERWNLSPDDLLELNPRLIVARMTGFGQFGPMSGRPGFGTLAEAMSGFAAMTGQPDGPPTLPPLALADGIAGLAMSYAIMVALHARERTGRGQVIDMAIIEPILGLLGPQMSAYKALGAVPQRTGNRSSSNAPPQHLPHPRRTLARHLHQRPAHRRAGRHPRRPARPGRAAVVRQRARPGAARGRAGRGRRLLDRRTRRRRGHRRLRAGAGRRRAHLRRHRPRRGPPQYAALGTFVEVPDEELGSLTMQNVLFRLSDTPGGIRWPGRPLGRDTDEVLGEIDYPEERIARLREEGVIA
ncbi:CoA transferase [Nonomuraea salmonea]|uniref:CaiB/BaiF CoA transferase family protein n=1 Tax=Nonomuraea salmonea TaxID=46181 RepID=UPI002FEBA33B